MESDLRPTFFSKWLRSWFDFMITLLRYAVHGIRRYWFVYLLIFGLFATVFYLHSSTVKSYYKATSSYTYLYLPKKVYGDMLYDLELLVEGDQTDRFSEVLKVKKEVGQTLLSFKATNLINKPLHEDYTTKAVPFYIHLEVESEEHLTALQKGITDFLNRNSFAKKKEAERLKKEKLKLKELDYQIHYVDSLLHIYSGESDTSSLADWMQFKFEKETARFSVAQAAEVRTPVSLLKAFQPIHIDRSQVVSELLRYYALLALCISVVVSTGLYWYKLNE